MSVLVRDNKTGGVLLDPRTGRVQEREAFMEERYLEDLERDPVFGEEFGIEPLPFNFHTRRPEFSVEDELRRRGADHILGNMAKAAEHPGIKNLTRNKHYIGGRTAASGTVARNVSNAIWNPHATSRIFAYEAWISPTAATSIIMAFARITARGTNSSTVAVAIANSIENDTAAPAGFALDLGYSAQPTVSAANLGVWTTPAAIGNGVMFSFPDPITISASSGLAIITVTAVALPVSDVTWVIGD